MTWKYRYRKQIIIGIILLLIITIPTTFYFLTKEEKKEKKKENEIVLTKKDETTKKEKKKKQTSQKEKIMVDIKGEVQNPGIYTLEEGQRVIDVINMAGGITKNGDTSVLNLSKKLKDEMVIIVYSHQEVVNFSYIKQVEQQVQSSCKKGVNEIENDACIEEKEETEQSNGGPVSINQATKEELMTLPGIGEKKAEDIIAYRETNGPFKAIEEIKNVSGIGDSLFDKIKENITL